MESFSSNNATSKIDGILKVAEQYMYDFTTIMMGFKDQEAECEMIDDSSQLNSENPSKTTADSSECQSLSQ